MLGRLCILMTADPCGSSRHQKRTADAPDTMMYVIAAVALGGGAYYLMGSSNKVEGKAKEMQGRAEGMVSRPVDLGMLSHPC